MERRELGRAVVTARRELGQGDRRNLHLSDRTSPGARGSAATAQGPQGFEDLAFGATPELEEQERISVERLSQHVVGGRNVLAGIARIGTGAGRDQIGPLLGKEA